MKTLSNRYRLFVTALIIVVSLLGGMGALHLLAAMRSEPEHSELVVPLVRVAYRTATRTTHQEIVRGTGRAAAKRRATISAEVIGVVWQVGTTLRPGCVVAEGDTLLSLDDGDYRNEVARSKARCSRNDLEEERLQRSLSNLGSRLEMLQQEQKTADAELVRLRLLAESDAASKSAIENQESVVAALGRVHLGLCGQQDDARVRLKQTAVDRLELNAVLARAERDLLRCTIKAPFDGEIESISVETGERVAPGTALFEMVDSAVVEVPIRVPASRFGEIRVGAKAVLQSVVEGYSWQASVTRVGSVVSTKSRTFTAFVVLDNKKLKRPIADGLFLDAGIDGTLHEDVFVVPRTAFMNNKLFVLKPAVNGEVAEVESRSPTIRRALASLILVDSGVAEGEALCLTNVDRLANGGRVLIGKKRGIAR